MVITEQKLAAGLEVVSKFMHEAEWDTYNEYGKHEARRKLKQWLLPFLIKLPDYATAETVASSFYEDDFWTAAESFIIERMRDNRLFDQTSDEELRRRLNEADVAEACDNLVPLVHVMLTAMEAFQEPEDEDAASLEELEQAWPKLDLDRELGNLLRKKSL